MWCQVTSASPHPCLCLDYQWGYSLNQIINADEIIAIEIFIRTMMTKSQKVQNLMYPMSISVPVAIDDAKDCQACPEANILMKSSKIKKIISKIS